MKKEKIVKKIYFKGYYGFQNVGDDIFCVTADWICNNHWKETQAIFIGDKLPMISDNSIEVNPKNRILRRIYEIYVCLAADAIIYFGGSVLSKVSGWKDIKFYFEKLRIFNKKIGTIGTSIGPFLNEKEYNSIKKLLLKFQFISVRDYSSLELLERMNVSKAPNFSFDPAIIITDIYPSLKKKKYEKNKIKIAVSLCRYERYKSGDLNIELKREKSLLNFIDSLLKENDNIEEIIFFEFNGNPYNGDKEITEEFQKHIKSKVKTSIVSYTSDTEKFCNYLNECDFLLGVRLHAGILAYALSIPFLLVEYHPKCTEFLNTINKEMRFILDNNKKNIESYNFIMNKGETSVMKDPKLFKDVFYETIDNIFKVL